MASLRPSPLVARLSSPVALVLTALLFALPFVAIGYDVPLQRMWISYSGAGLVTGGDPTVEVWDSEDGDPSHPLTKREYTVEDTFGTSYATEYPPARRPMAVVAIGLIAAAVLGGLLVRPARLRAIVGAAGALCAAVALFAAVLGMRADWADALFTYPPFFAAGAGDPDALKALVPIRYGFWLTFGLLILIGLVNVYVAVPGRKPPAHPADVAAGDPTASHEDSETALPGPA
jgi:hypothetical protein